MTHADVRRRLSEYLEGDLSQRDEDRVRAHLDACRDCAAELAALRRAVSALHELPAAEPRRDIADLVMARVRAGEARPPRVRFGAFSGGWLVPLAAAAGLGALTFFEGLDGQGAPLLERSAVVRQDPGGRVRLVRAEPPRGAAAPSSRDERRAAATLAASTPQVPLPPMARCIEDAAGDGALSAACAAWYSWFVAKALEDSGGFMHEVDRLPTATRDPWLRRVTDFAQRSGSAVLVGQHLRSMHDPRAITMANRFEHGPAVRQAGWTGR